MAVDVRTPARPATMVQLLGGTSNLSVDSYLELFTTLYGWMFYRVLWDVLVTTGIVYLPFLTILVGNWYRSSSDSGYATGSTNSLHRVELELFSAFFVVVLAAQPASLTSVRGSVLEYTPVPTINEPNPTPVTIATNDTTFGNTGFGDADSSVETPAWWYAVMALSSGFNHAIVEGMPRMSEIRQVVQLARLATIEIPSLRAEVSKFYNDCCVPARSKYLREQPTSLFVDSILNTYGVNDPDWMGSHVFRELTGYYDKYRAQSPISGWVYDPNRDTEYLPSSPPPNGRPYCDEWWATPAVGLRAKINQSVDVSVAGYSGMLTILGLSAGSERHLDVLARTALMNAPAEWTPNTLHNENRANSGWLGFAEWITKTVVSSTGVGITAGISSLTLTVLIQLLPMVQALILMCIYALLPLYLVFARYSIGAIAAASIAIFSVKFWTVLWYMAQWVDQNLITAMYPDTNVLFEVFVLNGEHKTKRLLLNIVTGLMYVGLPLLWSIMTAWAGIGAARSVDSLTSPYAGVAAASGKSSTNITKLRIKR